MSVFDRVYECVSVCSWFVLMWVTCPMLYIYIGLKRCNYVCADFCLFKRIYIYIYSDKFSICYAFFVCPHNNIYQMLTVSFFFISIILVYNQMYIVSYLSFIFLGLWFSKEQKCLHTGFKCIYRNLFFTLFLFISMIFNIFLTVEFSVNFFF